MAERYPQIFDSNGNWHCFFTSEKAANAWLKKQTEAYTLSYARKSEEDKDDA